MNFGLLTSNEAKQCYVWMIDRAAGMRVGVVGGYRGNANHIVVAPRADNRRHECPVEEMWVRARVGVRLSSR